MQKESRAIARIPEIRAEGERRTLASMAPPWDSLSVEMGFVRRFQERFMRGAFRNLEDDIVSTFEHEGIAMLGRTASGTLRLRDADDGLRYEVDLPDTATGRDVETLVGRGDVRGSSFEFLVDDEADIWERRDDGTWLRTIPPGSAVLYQVGPVTQPAYPDTKTALRCLERAEAEMAADAEGYRRAARLRLLALTELGLTR